eukprot:11063-Heterococcus_DN1.PRE.2
MHAYIFTGSSSALNTSHAIHTCRCTTQQQQQPLKHQYCRSAVISKEYYYSCQQFARTHAFSSCTQQAPQSTSGSTSLKDRCCVLQVIAQNVWAHYHQLLQSKQAEHTDNTTQQQTDHNSLQHASQLHIALVLARCERIALESILSILLVGASMIVAMHRVDGKG